MKTGLSLICVSIMILIHYNAPAAPILKVKESRIHDCGVVPAGNIVKHDFFISNEGDGTLEIFNIHKSCNCTSAQMSKTTIGPGEESILSLSVDTKNKIGNTVIDVVLETNTEISEHVLKLIMNCVPPSALASEHTIPFTEKSILKTIRAAARDYLRTYSKDYAARIRFTGTVKCMGKYREMIGYDGLFISRRFNRRDPKAGRISDKNKGAWFPVSGLRSFAWDAILPDTLETRFIPAPPHTTKEDILKTSYSDRPNQFSVWDVKRSLEVCSPLNPRRIRDFIYNYEYSIGDSLVYIGFKSKDGRFPRRNRVYGKGVLLINLRSGHYESITMENHIDYWSISPYTKRREIPETFEDHSVTVNYIDYQGKLFTESIDFQITWKEDDQIPQNGYYIRPNSRRFPNKNREEDSFHAVFTDFSELSTEQKKAFDWRNTGGLMSFFAPYNPQKDYRQTFHWLEWEKLNEDLCIGGITLNEQAESPIPYDSMSSLSITQADDDTKKEALLEMTRGWTRWIYGTEWE